MIRQPFRFCSAPVLGGSVEDCRVAPGKMTPLPVVAAANHLSHHLAIVTLRD